MTHVSKEIEVNIEGYILNLGVSPENKIIVACTTCSKILYTADEINSITRRVANDAAQNHSNFYKPNHPVASIERSGAF